MALRDKFTEFYYLGSEPLDGQGEKVDVDRGEVRRMSTAAGISIPPDGRLLGFDTLIGEDEDDCEIRIGGWKDFEGRQLPSPFTVSTGGNAFGTLEITNAELKPAE